MQEMAAKYGCDISRPARNAQEAVQWGVLCLPGCGEIAKRRRDVAGPYRIDPRHLHCANSKRGF
ncbi:pyruvate formate lyase family protein [Shigella flexneri]